MPILELNGFKAWITCKSRKVEQFSVDYDHDNNTVSCWIPGIVQSEFTVHWRCMNPENASSGHVWVDGKDVSSAIIRAGNYSPVKRTGAKLKDGRLRPFTFAKLNLTDDDRVANPRAPSLANIGTIEVAISWVKTGPATAFQGYEASAMGLVHEKSKKLGAIHTIYGKPVIAAKTRAITTAPLDPENPGPHARFIFRYRTLDMLQAIGIAPRAPRNPGSGDAAEEPELIEIDDDSDKDEPIPPGTEPAAPKEPPQGDSGDEEEDEAAVGVKEKPLFLEDEDATMQSGDDDMDTTRSVDMTASADRGHGSSSEELDTNRRSRTDLRTKSNNFFADDGEEE